ncbi:hypothetical protein [Vibrio diazotrophicus]|uniref:Uncharacterized protein n=1 Tax=Vibrio diazotrophicus TaxID=685 RepID=A0ABX4W919_VIBDI|nr:hypothetical protein [Vibrio diazotrophicus]PNI00280.1 hypothetical protein C1O25_13005 [Vibrio diazotrophicus]
MPIFNKSYKITHKGVDLHIGSDDLEAFAKFYFRGLPVLERCTEKFILDLYVYAHTSGLNPLVVLDEIKSLEVPNEFTRTKPATMFTRLPLKGIWHKHFFSSHFLGQNMQIAQGGGRLETSIGQVLEKYEGIENTDENWKAVAKELTQETMALFHQRKERSCLTGEWIIFIKHEGNNYYMSISFHANDDISIYDDVLTSCQQDFPHLTEIVKNYAIRTA